VFLSAFCWLGIGWIFFFFRREWGLTNWQVSIMGVVVIASGWMGFLGMEAYPFAFMLVLSLSLFLCERYGLSGLVTGLLYLTRGEGVMVLAVILIATLIKHWRNNQSIDTNLVQKILKVITGFALPLLFWSIYAYFTFGSILPNTLAAKQAQEQSGMGRSLLQRLVSEWAPLWSKSFAIKSIPVINFWWLILFIGIVDALFRRHKWLLFMGWIILYISGYMILRVSAYWWYQLPILFVLNLFFGLGVVKIVEALTKYIKPLKLSWSIAFFLTIYLLLVMAIPTVRSMLSFQGDSRGESYTTLSRWFREHTENTDSIAFIEVGYLGYYTDNRIVDLAGLVTPDIVPHVAQGDFTWGFWRHQPDYYIYLPDFDWALASIRDDPRFDLQYQPVATLPGPRETDFTIYERIKNE
jgi:hypothetical protein